MCYKKGYLHEALEQAHFYCQVTLCESLVHFKCGDDNFEHFLCGDVKISLKCLEVKFLSSRICPFEFLINQLTFFLTSTLQGFKNLRAWVSAWTTQIYPHGSLALCDFLHGLLGALFIIFFLRLDLRTRTWLLTHVLNIKSSLIMN